MNFDRCTLCKQMHCTDEKCKPIFFVLLRDYWFDDTREINELTEDEFDALEWRKWHAYDAQESAENLEHLCHQSDGLIEESVIYVKNEFDKITKHVVTSELVVEVR